MFNGYSLADWFILCLYIIIGLIGIIGNGFILHVIFKRQMRTTTFILIANQSFSDIAFGVVCISQFFFCSAKILSAGLPGIICCEIIYTLTTSMFKVSAFSMALISIERFLKIYYPKQNHIIKPIKAICIIWVLSIVGTMVALLKTSANIYFTKSNLFGCRMAYDFGLDLPELPKNIFEALFAITPLFVIIIMYSLVVRKIRAKKLSPEYRTEHTLNAMKQSKRHTTEMLIAIVIVYIISWLPIFIIVAVERVMNPIAETCTANTEQPIYLHLAFICFVSSICVNPFVYCYFNQIFKEEFWTILRTTKNLFSVRLLGSIFHCNQ